MKKIPRIDILYEDKDIFAFLDISPVNIGHTLVIPKKHCKNLLDCDDETLYKLNKAVKKISKAVYKSTNAEGFNIGVNNFSGAGQIVEHLHFHIMPRHKNDGFKLWEGKHVEDKHLKETSLKIRNLLKD